MIHPGAVSGDGVITSPTVTSLSATGAAVGGLIEAFLAVPLAAVVVNAVAAASDIDMIDDGA